MNKGLALSLLLLFSSVVLFLYWPALHGPFILDDQSTVTHNPLLQPGDTYKTLNPVFHLRERTFSRLTLALNGILFGNDVPSSFRIFNLFIHALNGLLVFLFLSVLTPVKESKRFPWFALFGAMLFLVHPLQTQAVNYVTQRMTLLSTTFSLGVLITYLNLRRTAWSGRSKQFVQILGLLICGILALLSKPTALVIFPLLLMLELFILEKDSQQRRIAWLLTAFTAGIIVMGALIPGTIDTPRITFTAYLLTQSLVTIQYFSLTLWPNALSIDHIHDIWPAIDGLKVVIAGVFHGLMILLAITQRKRSPNLAFGLVFIYVSFLPESALIPIKEVMVEHRMYFPMIGITIMASEAFRTLAIHKNRVIPFVSIALPILLAFRTYDRNQDWSSSDQLWQATQASSPTSARANYQIGLLDLEAGDTLAAIAQFQRADSLDRSHVPSKSVLGLIYIHQNNLNKAKFYLNSALELEPFDASVNQNMGLLLERRGKTHLAIEHYKRACRRNPNYPGPFLDLGTALLNVGKFEEALAPLEQAIDMGLSSARLFNNLGYGYEKTGRIEEAINMYEKALNVDSDYHLAQKNLDRMKN